MPEGMNAEVSLRLAAFPPELRNLYDELRTLLLESAAQDVEERLWAKMPSYYSACSFSRPYQCTGGPYPEAQGEAAGVSAHAKGHASDIYMAAGPHGSPAKGIFRGIVLLISRAFK